MRDAALVDFVRHMVNLRIDALSKRLRLVLASGKGAPTQIDVAAACGVDQGLISRISNGKVRRWTSRIGRVSDYVDNRHNSELLGDRSVSLPSDVLAMVEDYVDAGCDIDLLRRQLEILQDVQLRRKPIRRRVGRPVDPAR